MTRLDSRQPVPDAYRGAIIALGNFDGFHLGHQAVVGEAVRWARSEGRPVLVATFDPHPKRLFVPDAPFFRLTTLDQREELFTAAGADAMVVIHFDESIAAMTGEEWIARMLHQRFAASGVVTGEDFTFGKGRGGNVEVLKLLGQANRLSVDAVAAVDEGGEPVSSSRIREALQAADPHTATRLLTRPFAIEGEIIHGNKRGRELGWPTANMKLGNYLRPSYGIYAVRARLADGHDLDGVANVGQRPMFEPEELLEVHLFDFDGDLYGQQVEVDLHHYIRPEGKFGSLEELAQQIGRDAEQARELLKR